MSWVGVFLTALLAGVTGQQKEEEEEEEDLYAQFSSKFVTCHLLALSQQAYKRGAFIPFDNEEMEAPRG